MPEEGIASLMRDCMKVLENKDGPRMLSFFAEDGVWVTPEGTFRGKPELKRYLKWWFDSSQDIKITESGNGIIVQGNKAFYEHVVTSTVRGKRVAALVMCSWEFTDGKIQHIRTVHDRLALVKQAARGWPARWIVNSIVKQAEKGLR